MIKLILRKSLRFFFFILKFIGITFNYCRIKSLPTKAYGSFYKQALMAILRTNLQKDMRKEYAIGAILGALQAKSCGKNKITLIEFGVAKGIGFKILMSIAKAIRCEMEMDVKVIGFDNKDGLPNPQGYRDHPEIWRLSQYKMGNDYDDIEIIAKKNGGHLVIGDVNETLKNFNLGEHLLSFASIDVDFYSSTKPITRWLESLKEDFLLPATVLYFDDVINLWTYSSFAGESLAIKEFNHSSATKKIELKDKNLKLYALHDFKNPFRTGENIPKMQLHLFISDLKKYYFDKFDKILNSISIRFS